ALLPYTTLFRSILGGLMLGAIGVFIIERQFMKAAAFSLTSAALTFFGFMHGEAIGIGQTPTVAVSYLMVTAVLVACAKFATASAPAASHVEESRTAIAEPAA